MVAYQASQQPVDQFIYSDSHQRCHRTATTQFVRGQIPFQVQIGILLRKLKDVPIFFIKDLAGLISAI